MTTLQHFLKDESGATAIEYGLIAAGISVAIIAVVQGLGSKLNTTFQSVSTRSTKVALTAGECQRQRGPGAGPFFCCAAAANGKNSRPMSAQRQSAERSQPPPSVRHRDRRLRRGVERARARRRATAGEGSRRDRAPPRRQMRQHRRGRAAALGAVADRRHPALSRRRSRSIFPPSPSISTASTISARNIYAALRGIGFGRTTTYGELARQLGSTDWEGARDVGDAMGRNPMPIVIPCHRVLAAGDKLGGFSAYGGTTTKQKLLALEGVQPRRSGRRRRAAGAVIAVSSSGVSTIRPRTLRSLMSRKASRELLDRIDLGRQRLQLSRRVHAHRCRRTPPACRRAGACGSR